MSYDLRISAKVEGTDKYIMIAEPEYASPTYNLGKMFRVAMDWDYSQSEQDENGDYHTCYYPCDFALEKFKLGLTELLHNREKYEQYEPDNGWGRVGNAITTCMSAIECIENTSKEYEIPLDKMYWSW